jgi:hypothetical protein
MPEQTLSADVAKGVSVDAKRALDASFYTYAKDRSERLARSGAGNEVMEALIRRGLNDQQMQKIQAAKRQTLQEVRAAMGVATRQARDSLAVRASVIRPFNAASADSVRLAEDTKIQFFAPPYVDQWTSPASNGSGFSEPHASHTAGTFSFSQGAGAPNNGGSAASGAAIWVQFIPDEPLPRAVQVRPYTPFDYGWQDHSQYGYTAHNDGGFGIYVLSWDFDGGDQRLEQDYRYSVWSDGTGWWDNHANPSSPNPDSGYAYYPYNEVPYFEAQPGRVYRAAVWCFGSCDASAGFVGNALVWAGLSATAGFVVVGEQ